MNSIAQVQSGLGLGLLRSINDNPELFLGGEVYVKNQVTESFRVGATLGFYTKSSLNLVGTKLRLSVIPISIGGEYLFLKKKFRPYIGINAGLHGQMFTYNNESGTNFNPELTPLVGVEYSINDQIGINLNNKYSFVFYRNETTDGPDFFSLVSLNLGAFYRF